MKIKQSICLSLILFFYLVLYLATKYAEPCDGDCALLNQVSNRIRNNRETYVFGVGRPRYSIPSDTIIMSVKDTVGVNWNIIADSTCYFCNQLGLINQKLFILKNYNGLSADTILKKQCP